MRSRALAIALAASVATATLPVHSSPAQADMGENVGYYLPIFLWAATGTVLGAVLWPVIVGGGAAATPLTSIGTLINPGAAIGTVIGGVGYMMTRQQ